MKNKNIIVFSVGVVSATILIIGGIKLVKYYKNEKK